MWSLYRNMRISRGARNASGRGKDRDQPMTVQCMCWSTKNNMSFQTYAPTYQMLLLKPWSPTQLHYPATPLINLPLIVVSTNSNSNQKGHIKLLPFHANNHQWKDAFRNTEYTKPRHCFPSMNIRTDTLMRQYVSSTVFRPLLGGYIFDIIHMAGFIGTLQNDPSILYIQYLIVAQ